MEIYPKIEKLNFRFSFNSKIKVENCDLFNQYFYQISYLTLEHRGDNPWRNTLFSCVKNIDVNFLSLLKLKTDLVDKEIIKIINKTNYDKDKKREIKNALRKFRGKTRFSFKKFHDVKNSIELLSNRQLEYDDRFKIYYPLYEYVQNNKIDDFIKLFISLISAAGIENKSWVKTLLKKLVTYPIEKLIFIENDFSKSDREKLFTLFKSKLGLILGKIDSLTTDKMLLRMFASRLDLFFMDQNNDEFIKKYDGYWTLKNIREDIKNFRKIRENPGFWLLEIIDRVSDLEVRTTLEQNLDSSILNNLGFDQYWIFQYFFPRDHKRREIIVHKMLKHYESGGDFDRYLVINLIENEVIKKELAKKNPIFKKVIFQIKRSYFKKLLEEGKYPLFSLYKLIQLGDKDELNLWRYRIYGL